MAEDPVIVARNVSKLYEIGAAQRHDTLRDRIVHGFSTLGARLRGQPHSESQPFWALKNVSFELGRGEVLGIVGHNGAGKSTLLKILSRITEPTEGSVTLRGRVASLLEVGTGFHPELTGRENIFLNGSILGMTRAEIRTRFDAIVDFAQISQFLDTPVKHYSSGMYVRLAFSIAAHLDPEILIVDEVLAVGDLAFQKKCLGKMREVAASSGRTVLFVSHNLPVVRQVCTRALLLSHGQIAAEGSTQHILNLYTHGAEGESAPRIPEPTQDQRQSAFVSSIRVEALDGRSLGVARIGEPWRARVRVSVARELPDFVVALGVVTSEGAGVQTAWSPPVAATPGELEYVFTQDSLFLCADSYTIVLGLSSLDRSIQQFEATRLEVTPEGALITCPATSGAGTIVNSMRIEARRV